MLIDHLLFYKLGNLFSDHTFFIYRTLDYLLHRDLDLLLIIDLFLYDMIDLFLDYAFSGNITFDQDLLYRLNWPIDDAFSRNITFYNLFDVFGLLDQLFDFVIHDLFLWNLDNLLVNVLVDHRLLYDTLNRTLDDVLNWTLYNFIDLYIDGSIYVVFSADLDLLLHVLLEYPDFSRQQLIIFMFSDITLIDFDDVLNVDRVLDHNLFITSHNSLNRVVDDPVYINRPFNCLFNRDFYYTLDRDLHDFVNWTLHHDFGDHIAFNDLLYRAFHDHIVRHFDLTIHRYRLLDDHLDLFVHESLVEHGLLGLHLDVLVHVPERVRWSGLFLL